MDVVSVSINFGVSIILGLISFQIFRNFGLKIFLFVCISDLANSISLLLKILSFPMIPDDTKEPFAKLSEGSMESFVLLSKDSIEPWLIILNIFSSLLLLVPIIIFFKRRKWLKNWTISFSLAIISTILLSSILTFSDDLLSSKKVTKFFNSENVAEHFNEILLTLIAVIALYLFWLYLRKLKSQYTQQIIKRCISISSIGVLVYLLVQIIPLAEIWLKESKDLDAFLHFSGLIAKVIMMVGFYKMIFELYKIHSDSTKVAVELDKIIGLLFHELRPVITSIDHKVLLLDSDHEKYRMDKQSRRIVEDIDFENNRLKAIWQATASRYLSGNYSLAFQDIISKEDEFSMKIEVFSVNKIIESAFQVFRTLPETISDTELTYNESVKFRFEYSKNCFTMGNQSRLTQVFVNLFRNAFDAFPDGIGNIFVKTKVESLDLEDGKKLKIISIEVEDNGTGIPEKIAEKVFEESFSTKLEKTKIKGFGLAEVKKIINFEYNGVIFFESPVLNKKIKNSKFESTRFLIKLPWVSNGEEN